MKTFTCDVFLSHNQADKPRVRRLAERLRTAGLLVWHVPPKLRGVGGFDEWVIQPVDDHRPALDVFGSAVNFAARVVGTVEDAEIWLSGRAKEDIGRLGAAKHKHQRWHRHEGVAMKGFPEKFTVWALTK